MRPRRLIDMNLGLWRDYPLYVHNDNVYMYGEPIAELSIPEGSQRDIFKELINGAVRRSEIEEEIRDEIYSEQIYSEEEIEEIRNVD